MSYIWAAHLDLELVSRCSRSPIYAELDCTSCCHLSCQSLQKRLACSWVNLCLHSTSNIYWHPCRSDLPATAGTPSCGRRCLNWTWSLKNWILSKQRIIWTILEMIWQSLKIVISSVNLGLKTLLQPTHSRGHLCVFDSYSGFHFCVGKICIQKLLEEA